MQYFLTFLEGIISFISPCMLPMLPIYVSYFAGGSGDRKKTFVRILFFVLGFTVVFTLIGGIFAGVMSTLKGQYRTVLNVVTGIVVVLFGLSYLDVIHLPFFKGLKETKNVGTAFSAFVFGVVYSVSLSPCVGAFLGSALMMAAATDGAVKGALLLLCYSLGLGIPFALSALILDRLSGTFNFIRRNYKVINVVSGVFLIILGICMCFGLMSKLLMLAA